MTNRTLVAVENEEQAELLRKLIISTGGDHYDHTYVKAGIYCFISFDQENKKAICTGYNSEVKKDGTHAIYCGSGKWRELKVKNITVPDFIEKYFSLTGAIPADSFELGNVIEP